jgi:hypothetical protein
MSDDNETRLLDELQELVALEVKDIMATAAEEGFAPRDVVAALELALQAEIEMLATESSTADVTDAGALIPSAEV